MIRPYAIYIHGSVLQQPLRPASKRELVMRFIFSRGDFPVKDDAGHEIEVKIINDFAISYWADHAVREVKVINIQAADAP